MIATERQASVIAVLSPMAKRYLLPYRGLLLGGVLGGLVAAAAAGFGLPTMIQHVFPVVFGTAEAPPAITAWLSAHFSSEQIPLVTLWLAALFIPLLMMLRGLSTYFNGYLLNKAAMRGLRDLRRRGLPAAGYKPLACGDRGDARAMQAASDPSLPLDVINPIYLRAATAPYVAAQLENRRISPAELAEGYRRICGAGSPVRVEGAGGWEVPIAPGYSIADFAAELGLQR